MRSRHTQELTDSGWQTMTGVSDLTRNERQREFMVSMMSRLADFSSPTDIAALAREVAPHVTVDSSLSFLDAVGLGWTMRGLGSASILELDVPVQYATTDNGAAVLVSTIEIAEVVEAYLSGGSVKSKASFSG